MLGVLVPFAILDATLREDSLAWLGQAEQTTQWLIFALVAGLLILDIPLPIPSSLISTAAGALLGPWLGCLASTTGMVLGALLGYGVGRLSRGPVQRRLLSADELARAEQLSQRFGPFALIFSRPIPVLAEIFVVFAGIHRMPLRVFIAAVTPVNLAISLVYAFAGAAMGPWRAGEVPDGLAWPLLAALGLPALALWVQRRWLA